MEVIEKKSPRKGTKTLIALSMFPIKLIEKKSPRKGTKTFR